MLKSIRADEALHKAQNAYAHAQFSSAARLCRAALMWDRKLGAAHSLLGDIARSTDDIPAAISAYREATVVAPQDAQAWSSLGRALLAADQPAAAIDAYRQAVGCASAGQQTHIALAAAVHAHLGREEAVACYKQLLRQFPRVAEGYGALAAIYRDSGDLERAAVCALNALTVEPDSAERCCDAAEIRDLQGRAHEATLLFRQAIVLAPRGHRAVLALGCLLMRLEQYPEAEACFRSAIGFLPARADVVARLADALAAQGYQAEAGIWRRRADELAGPNGEAMPCTG